MSLLGALPVIARIHRQRRRRLAADRGRIEQQFGAHQRHRARAFRKPLVPADADADACMAGIPDAEPGVARAEIGLLLVAGPVGDVGLAVGAEDRSVRVDDRDAVEVGVVGLLEKADRQHHAEFARERPQPPDCGVLIERRGEPQVTHVLLDAEIRRLEQLLQQDHLRATRRGLAHQRLGAIEVRIGVPTAGELGRGDGDGPRSWLQVRGKAHARLRESCR